MTDDRYLSTERMRLRRLTPGDADALYALDREPRVLEFIDRNPPARERVVAELAACLAEYERHPDHGRFIAEDHDGVFLGWFGLRVGDEGPNAPDLGYRLRPTAWGRGLATEGGRALVEHAFSRLAAERVTAETMFVNHRSRRVMEKCGLSHVRTFHVHFDDPLPGTELGEVRYEITRAEWLRARASGRTSTSR